jgi:hypothetical protein
VKLYIPSLYRFVCFFFQKKSGYPFLKSTTSPHFCREFMDPSTGTVDDVPW